MNHGSFGILNSSFELLLSPENLSALTVGDGGSLYGIVYPKNESKNYDKVTVDHDLVLTPIPFHLWPRCARLQIIIRQIPGTLNKISEFLANKDILIIHSESTRSGYRYATWNLVISFSKSLIKDSDLNYDSTSQSYPEIILALNHLIQEIEDKFSDFIFNEDRSSIDMSTPVTGFCIGKLAYFYNLHDEFKDVYPLFEIKVKIIGGRPLLTSDSFKMHLGNIANEKYNNICNFIVYTELESKSMILRLSLIPEISHGKLFSEIGIEYKWNMVKGSGGSIGLLSEVSSVISENYSIWRSFNYVKDVSMFLEVGIIVFVVEDLDTDSSIDEVEGRLRRFMKKIKDIGSVKNGKVEFFNSPRYLNFSSQKIRSRVDYKLDQYLDDFACDLFISLSMYNRDPMRDFENRVIQELEIILRDKKLIFFNYKKIPSGEIFDEMVRDKIINSREFVVFYSDYSKESEWISTEWGAAWVLEKKITPICIDFKAQDLPNRLGRLNAIELSSNDRQEDVLSKLNKFVNELQERKDSRTFKIFNNRFS